MSYSKTLVVNVPFLSLIKNGTSIVYLYIFDFYFFIFIIILATIRKKQQKKDLFMNDHCCDTMSKLTKQIIIVISSGIVVCSIMISGLYFWLK
jgi:hypothetical protein